jgi:hypothetical protein
MFADGDLFEVANSLARLVGAPVTIEDPDTIVVAYSGGDQDVDAARIETILGRQVPVRYRDAIAAAGVFERLAVSDDVIVVDLPEARMVPRAVVAVRDGERLVASVWAALGGPPSEQQSEVLRSAVPVIAEHLRREHTRADAARRERADVVAGLIAGGESAEALAAERLVTGPWSVIAMRGDEPEVPQTIWSALALHLRAIAPSAVCAPLGSTVYAVLAADSAVDLMSDFMERFRHSDRVVVGVGPPVAQPRDLGQSRTVADQVAEALLRRRRTGVVETLTSAWVDVLVDRLEPMLAAHPDASPLTRLVAHDRQHRADLVETVATYLELGDVSRTASALHVHPNTLRNRLRRAREQCGVDLADPDTRLALMIALRARSRPTP